MRDRREYELENQRQQAQRAQNGPDTLHKAKIRLYDKIKARVSIKTMDTIIWAVVALIFAAIIVGMIIGP